MREFVRQGHSRVEEIMQKPAGKARDFLKEVMANLPVEEGEGTGCAFCAPAEQGLGDNQMVSCALQPGQV